MNPEFVLLGFFGILFLVVGGSGLIRDLGGRGRGRWGYDFWVVCLHFLL